MAYSPGWHAGERKMHNVLHIPKSENPTAPFLSPYGAQILLRAPLLALGALDHENRPWTTLLGGDRAFARPLGNSMMGVKAKVGKGRWDPVLEALMARENDGEVVEEKSREGLVSGLSIDLMSRSRVKLAGRMVAGAVDEVGPGSEAAEVQLVVKIEQSLGNCPKYLNKKRIIPATPGPVIVSESLPLPEEAVKLIAKADIFFISSSHHESTMGTNNRGGSPGFVRVLTNDASGTTLVFPEYSGNRFYQTLGNLQITPRAGIVFPDFETQDVLYVTGTTEIIIGKAAAALLPRSNLVVKVNVSAARFVQRGLAFQGIQTEYSPYNPPVRFLTSERQPTNAAIADGSVPYARLVGKDIITSTIARFRFEVNDTKIGSQWKPGQYVALAFEDEVGFGYSHMRDSDPKSLNDDYVRTFTISSPRVGYLPEDQFEITVRNVGVVTEFLWRQQVRAGLEIPLRGFGGSFALPRNSEETIPFVAGGIGITPILAQALELHNADLRLFWTINVRDANLVLDTFERYPWMARSAGIFISGTQASVGLEDEDALERIESFGAEVSRRRLKASDIVANRDLASTWYLCTSPAVRKSLLEWLDGKKAIYEDFGY